MPSENNNTVFPELTFFSRVSAAVSHEIKNVLAIINENAGLLEDLVLMSHKGFPLSPERLDRLADTIQTQIKRADVIVKTMNRFAHSADHPVDEVDLHAATVFITGLCKRMLRSKEIEINVVPPESPVRIQTSLFYLQELIFVCIESMVSDPRHIGVIGVEFRKMSSGAEIRFACESSLQNPFFVNSVASRANSLMKYIEARPVDDRDKNSFGIQLPESISALSKEQ